LWLLLIMAAYSGKLAEGPSLRLAIALLVVGIFLCGLTVGGAAAAKVDLLGDPLPEGAVA
jgi:hypothetical protein